MQLRGPIENILRPRTQGTIGTTDRYGFHLRGRTSHATRPGGPPQAARSRRAACVYHWRTQLSPGQINGWENAASSNPIPKITGKLALLNGFNFFIHINCIRLSIGLPITSTRTSPQPDYNATLIQSVPLPGGLALYQFAPLQDWTRNPQAVTVVYDRGAVSPTRNNSKLRTRIIGFHFGLPAIGWLLPIVAVRPYDLPLTTGMVLQTRTIRI